MCKTFRIFIALSELKLDSAKISCFCPLDLPSNKDENKSFLLNQILYLRIFLRVYKACCHATYLRFCPLILPLFYYLNIFNPFYSKIHDPTSPQRCRIRLDLAAPGCYWCLVDWAVNVLNIKDKYTLSTKKSSVCFLAMSQLKFVQIQKVRSVLKTTGSENFKTVLTFEIWPHRSWDNWG